MTKKQSLENVKESDNRAQLVGWAHEGTEQSIKQIKNFIKSSKNKELQDFAKIALEEAEFFYYSADSENEEKDFRLAKMFRIREDQLFQKMTKINAATIELEELDLDRELHNRIMKNIKDPKKLENWKYNFSEDYYISVKNRLEQLEDEVEYEKLWISEAEAIISKSKYKDMPPDFFDSIHEDGEGVDFWSEENDNELFDEE